jgi:hypothetical protein
VPQPVMVEDEFPRRTKPRRRRSTPTDTGPLQIVETAPGAEVANPDSPPAA